MASLTTDRIASPTQAFVDSPLTVAAMVLVLIAGGYSTVVLPLMVAMVAKAFAVPAAQAGWCASSEMLGIALGAFGFGLKVSSASRIRLIVLAGALATLGDAASAVMDPFYALLLFRGLAGIGAGGLLATGAAAVGATSRPDRNFALFVGAAFLMAAGAFRFLPAVLPTAQGLFLLLAVISALTIPVAFRIPAKAVSDGMTPSSGQAIAAKAPIPLAAYIALGGILAYYLGVGSVWPMMGPIGLDLAIETTRVGAILARASILGVAGSALAFFVNERMPRAVCLTFGLVGITGSLMWIAIVRDETSFSVATIGFIFCWNFVVPSLMGTLAKLDVSGRAVAVNMTLQYVGFATGPLLAGRIAEAAGPLGIPWGGAVAFTLCLALSLTSLSLRRQD